MTENLPCAARIRRGRVAVCLCPGMDRCGLCAEACAFGAIEKRGSVPEVDFDECVGCGACVNACPHGRMRLVDMKDESTAELTLKLKLAAPVGAGSRINLYFGGEKAQCEVLQAYPLKNGCCSIRIRTSGAYAFVRAESTEE